MRRLLPNVRDLQLCGDSNWGTPMYVSVFVHEAGGETTLVDTGWPDTADELIAELDAAEVSIDRVILTHDGGDHYGGLDRVIARDDPELYAPEAEHALYRSIDHEPDVRFADGDTLPGGMEAVVIPGHTAAPASLYLPEQETLIAADVLDGSDRRGLPPGYLLPPPDVYNEDHEAANRNLSKLLAYDIESVLVFHGSHVMNDAGAKIERFVEFREHFQRGARVVDDP